tara:strand:+ start:161 stop:487 length:327 start_codon:yes stop_codon:yes gene_type:complete
MRGLAYATIAGNLTGDPEVRSLEINNEPIQKAEFTIAVNTSKDGPASFLRCEAWRGLADVVTMAKKGESVLVTAKIRQETYEDKEGKTRESIKFQVDEFRFAGGKREE